jgi:hypothetical protein
VLIFSKQIMSEFWFRDDLILVRLIAPLVMRPSYRISVIARIVFP